MNDRLFKLFLVGVACAVFFVRFDAAAATYRFDLPSKTLEGGTMALGENAELVLRNIGTADPAALRTLLCDKEGNYLAASTNGFRADGTAAVGDMSLATAALAARFEGMSALKEIPLVFAVWDTANGTLLGSSLVQVKNNPLADADGTVPMDWGGVDYGDVAIAQQAYGMATDAWELSVATSNRMDALHGDYTAATNDLWEAVGGLESGAGALGDRIAALEGADFGGAVDSAVETLRDEMAALGNALGDGIEPAFTNGTARGLALSPLDAEAWEESDLAQTPGVYYTTRTNEFGVTIERLLHLVGGVDGVAIAGILAPGGITLPGTFYPLLGRQTWLTVTNWGQITNRYEELYGFTHGNINRLNTFTNDIWRYAQTNRAIATQTRDSLANEKIYRQLGDDDLSNFVVRVRSDVQGWRAEETNRLRQLELATNALAGRVATNEAAIATLNTSLGGVDAGSIAQLRADVDAISAQSAATFTNGTARGLAITPIDHRAGYEAGFSSTPGVWATTEYDYLGEPYGHHLLLHGEGTAALDLSSTGIVANAGVAAEGFTLGTNTVTDWEVFATAESVNELWDAFNTRLPALDSLTLDGQEIHHWSDLASYLQETSTGAASKTWVNEAIKSATNTVHGWLGSYASTDYVDTQIGGLQDALSYITIEDGEATMSLTGVTTDIAGLKQATNDLAGAKVDRAGDTMTGTLAVPGVKVGRDLEIGNTWNLFGNGAVAQGVRSRVTRQGSVAAGLYANATDEWAVVWSGTPGFSTDLAPGSVFSENFSVEPGGTLILSNSLPRPVDGAFTLGRFFGTEADFPSGQCPWERLAKVTFKGWAAASGMPETYWFQGDAWYTAEPDAPESPFECTDEAMDYMMFLCPMEFTPVDDDTYEWEGFSFDWSADMIPLERYASHGPGTINVNPEGGLDGFYVGDATLADAIAAHGVASLNDADGDVTLQAVSPLSISPDPQDGSILKLSFADTYVRTLNGQSGDVTLTSSGGGISFNGATVENAGVTRISYVSPTAGLGGTYPAYSWSGDVQIGVRDGYFSIKRAEEGNDAWHKLFEIGGGGGGAQALPVFSLGSTSPRLTVTPGGTYSYTLSLAPAVDSLNGATGNLRLLKWDGAQLGVTDGAIRLPEPPNALTAMGEDVLAPVLVVEENSPRITGFEVDEFGDAVITFWGSATTNRLEWLSAEAESEWAPWDMCSWSYSGTTGTVTVVGAEQGAFYRIVVPEGYGTPDRTNVFLVASVPVYLDDPSVPGNRLATLADVQQAVERGGGAAKTPVVTRRAYKDNTSVVPTNGVAWNFANDGVYIADLSVGGWTEESATVTTNTTTVTHPGTMTFNGETIHSWAELATYADGVELTVETGVESVNGAEGLVRLVAGDNVSIETDTATGAITISATGGGGGGGGGGGDGGGGGAWTPGSALYTTNDWTMPANANAYAAFGMNTSATNLTLTLSAQSAYQTIVVRKFGAANELNIIGTTTNTLYYDGEVLVLDYWPADAGTEWAGGWYWRRQ